MDSNLSPSTPRRWRKVVCGGMQPGFHDNHTDDSFLEDMVMNANVVKTDMIGALRLNPTYQTLTRSISSDSIWAVTSSLLALHLFLHDYSGPTTKAPGALQNPTLTSCISLNTSVVVSVFLASGVVASVFDASGRPSRLHVFAVMLFSLLAPLVTYGVKKYSFPLHLLFSIAFKVVTLASVYTLYIILFVAFLVLLSFVNVVRLYWIIRIQEYKFEINGPWDEANSVLTSLIE